MPPPKKPIVVPINLLIIVLLMVTAQHQKPDRPAFNRWLHPSCQNCSHDTYSLLATTPIPSPQLGCIPYQLLSQHQRRINWRTPQFAKHEPSICHAIICAVIGADIEGFIANHKRITVQVRWRSGSADEL